MGTEVASRLNAVSVYDGFDPTGVCTIFGAAAIAGRILGLDAKQMKDALALAFNKAGGSMQSNIDGSLAVRVIQGFVSQSGIVCAQLAQDGISHRSYLGEAGTAVNAGQGQVHAGLLFHHHIAGGKDPLRQRMMLVEGEDLQEAGEQGSAQDGMQLADRVKNMSGRGSGHIGGGPSNFSPKDRKAFANQLDRWLAKHK